MAPEQKGHFRSIQGVHAYSLSVDIWAIGVITMELILTHPFLYNSDQEDYIRGIKSLDFQNDIGAVISASCRDFVTSLLAPDPTDRPTAEVAISHPWFAEVAMWLDQHDSYVLTRYFIDLIGPKEIPDPLLTMKLFHLNARMLLLLLLDH